MYLHSTVKTINHYNEHRLDQDTAYNKINFRCRHSPYDYNMVKYTSRNKNGNYE